MAGNTFSVRIDDRRLQQILRESPDKADDLVAGLTYEGQGIITNSFNTSPPGRTYRRGKRVHVASVGGYPPNIDFSKLMNALHVYKARDGVWAISTGDTDYAAGLEFGTAKMEARPFMRPVVPVLKKRAPEVFDRLI